MARKSIYVIIAMGIASCVVLALMMQHALKVQHTHNVPPVVSELTQMFGSRFSRACEFRIGHEAERKVAEVTVFPLMSSSRTRLARSVGDYVWRRLEDASFDAIVVTCDDGLGRRHRYLVPRPKDVNRRMRELGRDEPVFAAPATTPR